MEPEQVLRTGIDDGPLMKGEPEINPLIPDGIEKFVPFCIVCRQPVPKKRATGRSKDTCSPECHKVLRKYRKYVLESSHCPACYHPSTPEQRREFIAWRKSRGDRRATLGRPPVKREENLRKALAEAVGLLKAINEEQGGEISAILEPVSRFEKLIDTKAAE